MKGGDPTSKSGKRTAKTGSAGATKGGELVIADKGKMPDISVDTGSGRDYRDDV
jgi:hypothetical protein